MSEVGGPTLCANLGRSKGSGEKKVSGLNGTVEDCKVRVERAEILLTRDRFFEILIVVW